MQHNRFRLTILKQALDFANEIQEFHDFFFLFLDKISQFICIFWKSIVNIFIYYHWERQLIYFDDLTKYLCLFFTLQVVFESPVISRKKIILVFTSKINKKNINIPTWGFSQNLIYYTITPQFFWFPCT